MMSSPCGEPRIWPGAGSESDGAVKNLWSLEYFRQGIRRAAHRARETELCDVESEHAVDEIELGVRDSLLRFHVLHIVDHSHFHFLTREFERFLVDLHVSLRD